MDDYAIREEFLVTRNNLIEGILLGEYNFFIKLLSNSTEMNLLQRFKTSHEEFVYLTIYDLIISECGLTQISYEIFNKIETLIKKKNLDFDRLDPFSVASYYHSKALYNGLWETSINLDSNLATESLLKSQKFYIKAKDADRALVVLNSLAGFYIENGNITRANSTFKEFEDLRNKSTGLSEERKKVFSIRSSIIFIRISYVKSPNNISNINILLSRLYTEINSSKLSNRNMYFLADSVLDLIRLSLECGNVRQAKLFLNIVKRTNEQFRNDFTAAGLPNPATYLNESWNLYLFDNVIKLYEPATKLAYEGYENLEKLISWGKIPVIATLLIINEQIKFLLGLYRGFGLIETLNQLINKIEEVIRMAETSNFEFYKFKAILIKVRVLMLQEKKSEGLDLLVNLRDEYRDSESDHLLNFLEKEIKELTNVKLSSEYLERVKVLNFERYIRDSKLLLKEIQNEDI